MKKLLEHYQDAICALPCEASLEEFKVNNLTFHAVVAGPKEGKLVLLLHGFPECWYTWRKQIPVLVEAGYRVVAPDLRGYGLNDKPKDIKDYRITYLVEDIRQLILAQNVASAIVIAHDWGGAAAWNFAMWHPEFIERLIILNAPHPVPYSRELRNRSGEQYKMAWYMRFFQKPSWPERLLTANTDQTVRWFLIEKWGYKTDLYRKKDLAVYASLYAEPDTMQAMLNWYRASFQYRTKDMPEISQIALDTLVIWGEQDKFLSINLLKDLEEWVPNLEINRIKNAGHFVQNEAPDEVNQKILSFLKKSNKTVKLV